MSKEKVLSAGESLSEAFTGSPGLCLLFTLYWVWSNVTFQSTFFFPSFMVIGGHSVASWAIPVLFAAGTLVVLALRCRFHQQDEGRVLVTAGSILSFMGAVVLAARSLTNPADVSNLTVLVIVLGGAMVGIGTSLCLIGVAHVIACQKVEQIFAQSLVGALFAAIPCMILWLLPRWAACMVICATPLALGALAGAESRRLSETGRMMSSLNQTRMRFPVKLFVTAVLHGIGLGTLFGLSSALPTGSGNLVELGCAMTIASVLLAWLAFRWQFDYNTLLYRIAFIAMALGATLVIALPSVVELASFVQLVGFCLLHLVMWGLNYFLIKDFGIPAAWLVGLTTAGWMCGELAGGVMAFGALGVMGVRDGSVAVEGLMVFMLMSAALLLLDSRNMRDGWGLARPIAARPAYSNYEAAFGHLASAYGLSEREAAVFALFARGRNRKVIAQMLVVSEETVKSHIAAIYRKTGVNSQQQVIDLLDEELAD